MNLSTRWKPVKPGRKLLQEEEHTGATVSAQETAVKPTWLLTIKLIKFKFQLLICLSCPESGQ